MALLFAIMALLLRLLFCKCPDYYSSFLHYLQKDYYCTYGNTIISLIVFGIYYCYYCNYHTIIYIIVNTHYYDYYIFLEVLFQLSFSMPIIGIMTIFNYYFKLWFLTHHYNNYGFPNLLYTLLFFQHIIFIMTIMVKKMATIRIISIIAIIYMYPPPAHLSGIWLQILDLTAGMHSYTSEAAIAAKILRNPGGQCTSILAGTSKKQAFSTVFDPRSSTSGTLQSRIFGQMFTLPMHY